MADDGMSQEIKVKVSVDPYIKNRDDVEDKLEKLSRDRRIRYVAEFADAGSGAKAAANKAAQALKDAQASFRAAFGGMREDWTPSQGVAAAQSQAKVTAERFAKAAENYQKQAQLARRDAEQRRRDQSYTEDDTEAAASSKREREATIKLSQGRQAFEANLNRARLETMAKEHADQSATDAAMHAMPRATYNSTWLDRPEESEPHDANRVKALRDNLQRRLAVKSAPAAADPAKEGFDSEFMRIRRKGFDAIEAETLARRNLKHAMDDERNNVSGFGAGEALRRVMARMTTKGLQPVLGETAAGVVGGSAGILAASVLLRMGWMIGDALLKIPQMIGERVDSQRSVGEIGARAATDEQSKEWLKSQAGSSALFERINMYAGNNKLMRGYEMMPGLFQEYQITGRDMPPDINAQRAANQAAALSASSGGRPIETDPAGLVRALKMLESPELANAGAHELESRPWLRERLIQNRVRDWNLRTTPAGREQATQGLEAQEKFGVDTLGGLSSKELKDTIQATTADARVRQELAAQGQQNRWTDAGIMAALGVHGVGALSGSQKGYVSDYQNYLNGGITNTGIRGGFQTGYAVDNADISWLQKLAKTKNDMANGDFSGIPGLESVSPHASGSRMPMGYDWTSATGLAERMQQMQTNAPVDYQQQTAANSQTSAKHLASIDAKMGSSLMRTSKAQWNITKALQGH